MDHCTEPDCVNLYFQNINAARDKLIILAKILKSFEIVCVVEQQLSGVNSNQLDVSCKHKFFICPARITGGRPSGGIMIGVNNSLECVLLETNDTFVVVDLGHIVILAVYMPTNYRNEQSNERFAKACARVSKISHKIRASGKAILLCGDQTVRGNEL